MRVNHKKKMVSTLLAAAMLSAAMAMPTFAADDRIIFEEDFDGYAAEGENLIGKLIRTTDKPNTDTYPTDIWSVNTSKFTGGNSVNEPAAFVHSPYGTDDDYCAYYYSPSTAAGACWDQLIYTFGKNTLQDGDVVILEGKIRNTPYYQNGEASGNFANSFELGLSGSVGYIRLAAIDSGVTLGTNAKNWGLYNLAGDWLHFSLAVELNAADMSSCPVNLVLSGYTIEHNAADYTLSGVANLSVYTSPSDIDSVRFRGIVQAADDMAEPGNTLDTQRHGIYFDNAKVIKAGDFKMSLNESADLSELQLSFSHSFNTKLDEAGGYANVGTESFKITADDGTEVPVSAVNYSVIDPTYAALSIDQSALKPNTTYTITSTVKDVLGNTPSSVSFTTTGSEPTVSDVSEPEKFEDGSSVAFAYTFTVAPNGNTLTGVKVSSETPVTGDTTKTINIPSTESEIKFGIIAVHELNADESADSVTAPEFTAEALR